MASAIFEIERRSLAGDWQSEPRRRSTARNCRAELIEVMESVSNVLILERSPSARERDGHDGFGREPEDALSRERTERGRSLHATENTARHFRVGPCTGKR